MEHKARKPRVNILSILLIPVSIVGMLASFQEYDEIKKGTADWDPKFKEPWYIHNPDGFLIYIIIEAIAFICILILAITNLITGKNKYWEIAMTLFIVIQLGRMINKFIKG